VLGADSAILVSKGLKEEEDRLTGEGTPSRILIVEEETPEGERRRAMTVAGVRVVNWLSACNATNETS
jgi:hypothetical protein